MKHTVSTRQFLFSMVVLWVISSLSAFAKEDQQRKRGYDGFDVVTMKNGDIHQGTVALEKLIIKTGIGNISVPYHQLSYLKIGSAKEINQTPDLLTTRLGETINGHVISQELTMFRVLDTTLPLDTKDILTIDFASRGIPMSPPHESPDAIITNMGDQLLGTIHEKIRLKNSNSDKTIKNETIQYIDLASPDEEDIYVQITLFDKSIHQGLLDSDNILFETHYGQQIEIPITKLSGLRFRINHDEQNDLFMHRWDLSPNSLFRDRLVDGTLGPEMLIIKGETYQRGDAHGDDDEKPPTSVTPGSFAIGVFEVTYREYDQFCEDTGRDKPDDADWGRANRPVINVTWKDAIAYTEWLSRKTGKHYRLPSDAEWEFAARAGSTTKFWWGDEVGTAKANCEGCKSLWDGAQTSPVGRFPANPFGLHDTAGNVFEWVADCWHDKFSEAPADGSPMEKPGCGKRVIRGGAWSFPAKEIRSANRWRDFPSRRSDDTGFRVARDIEKLP